MKIDNSSITHTAWNCKYHIVFAPQYRRQAIYGKIKFDIGQIMSIKELVDLFTGEPVKTSSLKYIGLAKSG